MPTDDLGRRHHPPPRPETQPGRRRGALGADPRTRPGVCGPTRRGRRLVPRDRLRLLGNSDPGLPGPRVLRLVRLRERKGVPGVLVLPGLRSASPRCASADLRRPPCTSPLSAPREPSTMRPGSATRSPGVRTDPLPSLGRLAARDEAPLPGRRGPGALRRRSLRRGAPSRGARGGAGLRLRRRLRRRLRVEPGRSPHARARARRASPPSAFRSSCCRATTTRWTARRSTARPAFRERAPASCTCSRTRGPSPWRRASSWSARRGTASGRSGISSPRPAPSSRRAAGPIRVCVAHGAVDALSPDRDDPARIALTRAEAALADGPHPLPGARRPPLADAGRRLRTHLLRRQRPSRRTSTSRRPARRWW